MAIWCPPWWTGTQVRNDLACLLLSSHPLLMPSPSTTGFSCNHLFPACQVFNAGNCKHTNMRTHTHTHTQSWACMGGLCVCWRGQAGPAFLGSNSSQAAFVIVKEGDLGFLLKSCRAEHLFKEALGAGGREGG